MATLSVIDSHAEHGIVCLQQMPLMVLCLHAAALVCLDGRFFHGTPEHVEEANSAVDAWASLPTSGTTVHSTLAALANSQNTERGVLSIMAMFNCFFLTQFWKAGCACSDPIMHAGRDADQPDVLSDIC